MPDVAAVLAVVLATLLVLGAGATLVANEARALSAELPSYQSTIRGKLRNLRKQMRAPGMFDGAKRTLDIRAARGGRGHPRHARRRAEGAGAAPPVSPAQQAMAALGSVSGPLADAALGAGVRGLHSARPRGPARPPAAPVAGATCTAPPTRWTRRAAASRATSPCSCW
ncbi:putative phytochrome sensor protein [Alicycliphilus sp. B1]|nr:putative phytochrome sensor protein [Alicycliphilus sp. B1]